MSTLRELKLITKHYAFNVARWQDLCADPALAAPQIHEIVLSPRA